MQFSPVQFNETDMRLMLIAGLAATYIMDISAQMLAGIFKMQNQNMGGLGVRFMGGREPGFWFVGYASHLAFGVLLSALYATLWYPMLGNEFLPSFDPSNALHGFIWGILFGLLMHTGINEVMFRTLTWLRTRTGGAVQAAPAAAPSPAPAVAAAANPGGTVASDRPAQRPAAQMQSSPPVGAQARPSGIANVMTGYLHHIIFGAIIGVIYVL